MTSYAKRQEARKQLDANKEREREMKEEKEAERQVRFAIRHFIVLQDPHLARYPLILLVLSVRPISSIVSPSLFASYLVPNILFSTQAHIQRIKDKRAAKEEKARYEKMAEKMHAKRVERLRRREKRNKLLSS